MEHTTTVRELIALLHECYERIECFDAEAHRAGTCLDQRVKKALQTKVAVLDDELLAALQTIKDRCGASGKNKHDQLIWTIADAAIRKAKEKQ